MFRYTFKRFYRNKGILVITFLAIILCVNFGGIVSSTRDLNTELRVGLITRITMALYFMVCSYEFFSQIQRSGMEEIVRIGGLKKEYWNSFLIFLLLDVFVSLINVWVGFWENKSFFYVFEPLYLSFIIQICLVYYILPFLISILVGIVFSKITKRLYAYVAILCSYMLWNGMITAPLKYSYQSNLIIYRLIDIFSIFNRDFRGLLDALYYISVDPVEYEKVLFWLFFALTGLMLVFVGKRNLPLLGVCTFLCILCFGLFMQPSGEFYCDEGVRNSWMDDQYYYMRKPSLLNLEKEGGFSIRKISGKLTFGRELSGDIKIEVDQDDLEEYSFTLYHGYKVKKITDERGKELPFKQSIDALYVYPKESTKVFHIYYKGCSRVFYATYTASNLPGFFAYVPIAGVRTIYYKDDRYKQYNLSGNGYDIDYDLTIGSPQKVYSNLKEVSDHHFVGKTDGVSLVSSAFLKVDQRDHCRIIYSYLDAFSEQSNHESRNRELSEKIKSFGITDPKFTVFDLGVNNASVPYINQDHIYDMEMAKGLYSIYQSTGVMPSDFGYSENGRLQQIGEKLTEETEEMEKEETEDVEVNAQKNTEEGDK